MPSKEELVLDALLARVTGINGPPDYTYNLGGGRVALGRATIGPDDALPIARVIPGEPAIDGQGDRVRLRLPVTVIGLVAADPANPLRPALRLQADLKRAIFRPGDRTMGGLVIDDGSGGVKYAGERLTDRQEGGETVSCEVDVELEFIEAYGGAA